MSLRLRVIPASPELVRARSSGAIARPEDLDDATFFGPPGAVRAAHVALAEPVLHPLFVADRPSPVALLLDLRHRDLPRAARRGPEAARALASIDLAALAAAPTEARTPGKTRRLARRVALARAMLRAGVRPAWLSIEVLPVPPPEQRLSWAAGLDEGYRRVVACNEALRRDRTEARYASLVDAVGALFAARAAIVRHLAVRHAPVHPLPPPPVDAAAVASGGVAWSPSSTAILGLFLSTRPRAGARGDGLVLSNVGEAVAAYAHGAAEVQAGISLRVGGARVRTTVGRVLLFDALGGRVPLARLNETLDAPAVRRLVEEASREDGAALAAALSRFGRRFADASGFSSAMDDLRSPEAKAAIVDVARDRCEEAARAYRDGGVSEGERYNLTVDAWTAARDRLGEELVRGLRPESVLGVLRAAGALDRDEDLVRCAAMVGPVSMPSGEIVELPVVHSLAEGLAPHEAMLLAGRARKDALDRRDRHREARLLFQRLAAELGGVRVVEQDCGTRDGVTLGELLLMHRILVSSGRRALGRTTIDDVRAPGDGGLLVRAGATVDAGGAGRLDRALVDRVAVRSPIACAARGGVCARCYGVDPATARPVVIGRSVGADAARAVGQRAADLVPPRFTLFGGTLLGHAPATAPAGGVAYHEHVEGTPAEPGAADAPLLMIARAGRVSIRDERGEVLASFRVVRGDHVLVPHGARVVRGDPIVARGSFHIDPLFADVPEGAVAKVALAVPDAGVVETVVDEVTGLSRRVVGRIPPGVSASIELAATLRDGERVRIVVPLHERVVLHVEDGSTVKRGALLATRYEPELPAAAMHAPWGGIAALSDILRPSPAERAFLAEHAGVVRVVTASKRFHCLHIDPDDGGPLRRQAVPKGYGLLVQGWERVRVGELLVAGYTRLCDSVRLFGRRVAAERLLDDLTGVFVGAGVPIAGVHLEMVVRSALRAR